MKHAVRLLLAVALLALAWWAWTFFSPNPKTVILHRLDKLAKLASFPANENIIARAANVEKLRGFFSEGVVVRMNTPDLENHNFQNREELMQAVFVVRSSVRGVKAKLSDPNIEITAGNQEAIVDLALHADVANEKDSILQELKFNLKKSGGDWLITRIETVKTLK